MAVDETRGYVEHRLRQVGWSERPTFDDAAFTRIFDRTAGVPRRVNLLCNRLLLSAYLESTERIARVASTLTEAVAAGAIRLSKFGGSEARLNRAG